MYTPPHQLVNKYFDIFSFLKSQSRLKNIVNIVMAPVVKIKVNHIY